MQTADLSPETAPRTKQEGSGLIKHYVVSKVLEEQTKALNDILLDVHRGLLDVKDVVCFLGPYLTSTDDLVRSRGTLLLAEVLTRLGTLKMNSQQLLTLLTFFQQRLQDYPCAKEVIKGLAALFSNHSSAVPPSWPPKIFSTLFKEITVQSLPQSARKNVFDSLLKAMQGSEATQRELAAMKGNLLVGFVQAMDGEKDPRNLVTCFTCAEWLLDHLEDSSFNVDILLEIMEVTSCYFPITFSAPRNDPYGITGDDLKRSLRKVLSHRRLGTVAAEVFPLLLEKLEQQPLSSVKLDSLLTMQACIQGYGGRAMQPLLSSLWPVLKAQLIGGEAGDESVKQAAVAVVVAVTAAVCPRMRKHTEGTQSQEATTGAGAEEGEEEEEEEKLRRAFLWPLLDECAAEFQVPDAKMARVLGKVWASAAAASAPALSHVMGRIWGAFRTRLDSKHIQPSQSLAMFENLAFLLDKALALFQQQQQLPPPASSSASSSAGHPLAPYAEDMVQILSAALVSEVAAHRCVAADGLATLACLSSASTSTTTSSALVASAQVKRLVDRLSTLLQKDGDAAVRDKCLQALQRLCSPASPAPNAPSAGLKHVLSLTIPSLFSHPLLAPASSSSSSSTSSSSFSSAASLEASLEAARNALAAAAALSICSAVAGRCLPQIMRVTQAALAEGLKPPSANANLTRTASQLQLARHALSSLDSVVRHYTDAGGQGNIGDSYSVVGETLLAVPPTLLQALVKACEATATQGEARARAGGVGAGEAEFGVVVNACQEIVGRVVRAAAGSAQQALLALAADTFLGPLGGDGVGGKVAVSPFRPLSCSTAPPQHTRLLPLLAAMVGPVRPQAAGQAQELLARIQREARVFLTDCPTFRGVAQGGGVGRPQVGWDSLSSPYVSMLEMVGSVANKMGPAQLAEFVEQTVPAWAACAANAAEEQDRRLRATACLVYICKALIMRPDWADITVLSSSASSSGNAAGQEETEVAGEMLIAALVSLTLTEDQDVANLAAEGFGRLLSDSVYLSLESHAVQDENFAATAFNQLLPRLLGCMRKEEEDGNRGNRGRGADSRRTSSSVSMPALQALCSSLAQVNWGCLILHLSTVLPYIVLALGAPASGLRLSALLTLTKVGGKNPHLAGGYISSLFPALLSNTCYRPSVAVRLLSLQVLESFCLLDYMTLHPFKMRVINGLHDALDDRKRLVRQQAVRTRNRWFTLSAS